MAEAQRQSVGGSGEAYEPYVGRWSRLVAREFLHWLALAPSAHWLDVGCGTGALSQTILTYAAPAVVHGIDPSEGYLTVARHQVRDARVRFEPGDARQLPLATATYDAVVSGLVLHFIPDVSAGLAVMVRVTKPSGTVAALSGTMQAKWNSCVIFGMLLLPASQRMASVTKDDGFPSANPNRLKTCLPKQGYTTSRCALLTCRRIFKTLMTIGHRF